MTAALLTQRQREVLDALVDGLSNGEIGARLGISENTAKKHLTDIAARIGLPAERVLLAVWWTRREAWAAWASRE